MKVKGFVVSPNDEREKIKENLLKMLSAQGIEVGMCQGWQRPCRHGNVVVVSGATGWKRLANA